MGLLLQDDDNDVDNDNDVKNGLFGRILCKGSIHSKSGGRKEGVWILLKLTFIDRASPTES